MSAERIASTPNELLDDRADGAGRSSATVMSNGSAIRTALMPSTPSARFSNAHDDELRDDVRRRAR